jgi:hypothetical protein
MMHCTTKVRPRPEGGGDFAPALGGGSGANRAASGPGVNHQTFELRISRAALSAEECRHD